MKFEWIKDYEVLRTSAYNTTSGSVKSTRGAYLTTHDLMFHISSIAEQGHYWCRLNFGSAFQRDSSKATVILKGNRLLILKSYKPIVAKSSLLAFLLFSNYAFAIISSFTTFML